VVTAPFSSPMDHFVRISADAGVNRSERDDVLHLRMRVDADRLTDREQFDPRLTGRNAMTLPDAARVGRLQSDITTKPRPLLKSSVGKDLDRPRANHLGVEPSTPTPPLYFTLITITLVVPRARRSP